MRSERGVRLVLGALALLAGLLLVPRCLGQKPELLQPAPSIDEAFWKHWGDGRAELAGYDLTYPRYGEARRGTAVAIFVTESFSNSARVKHEDPHRDAADVFPVLKLNLVQDFATGVYDYNLMTSAFVALAAVHGRPPGHLTKVSFSSQEWCGQVYAQLLFDHDSVRHESHSYFDGEGDRSEKLPYPADGLAEDALLPWARGLAAPLLGPGESRSVQLLRSLEASRLQHVPLAWQSARLSRDSATRRVTVPAGTFEVDVLRASVERSTSRRTYPPAGPEIDLPATSWTFFVEHEPPRRLIKWTRGDGLAAELLASSRLEYWTMNRRGFEEQLRALGLQARRPRAP